jgi:hypothetical protein
MDTARLVWEVIEHTRCAACGVRCNPVFVGAVATCGDPACKRQVETAVVARQRDNGAPGVIAR